VFLQAEIQRKKIAKYSCKATVALLSGDNKVPTSLGQTLMRVKSN
jgi:hypothetical protein